MELNHLDKLGEMYPADLEHLKGIYMNTGYFNMVEGYVWHHHSNYCLWLQKYENLNNLLMFIVIDGLAYNQLLKKERLLKRRENKKLAIDTKVAIEDSVQKTLDIMLINAESYFA